MADAVRLTNLGIPEPTAKELAAQIEAQGLMPVAVDMTATKK